MEIPQGNSREEVKLRDQIIKDFYAGWIAENPEKKMWNEDLQDYILVKYLCRKSCKAVRVHISSNETVRTSDQVQESCRSATKEEY